jgi:hypothetical protein
VRGLQQAQLRRILLTGDVISDATVRVSDAGEPYVSVSFDSVGARLFGEATEKNVGKALAIVLDGNVHSAPVIRERIPSGQAQISGGFTITVKGRAAHAGTHREEGVSAIEGAGYRNLDENDAFVIFPEGGNFTPERRQRGIDKLRRLGLERMARRAERMENVLAPRPGGLLAALDAAPGADVVLVAHTGLDHLLTVRDLWRELPMDKQIIMRWWRVPREEIPEDREGRIDWLYSWWEQIDAWVEEHRPVDLPPRFGRRGAPV